MNIKHELESPVSTLKTIIALLREDKMINDRLVQNSSQAFERIEDILNSMNRDTSSIYGMWKLTKMFSLNESTNEKSFPFGKNVEGHISYNQDGTMSVLIESESGNVTAYTAKYIVTGDNIEHQIIQSTNKKWLETSLFRRFEIDNDLLKISTFKENSDDKNTSTHLVWKKVI